MCYKKTFLAPVLPENDEWTFVCFDFKNNLQLLKNILRGRVETPCFNIFETFFQKIDTTRAHQKKTLYLFFLEKGIKFWYQVISSILPPPHFFGGNGSIFSHFKNPYVQKQKVFLSKIPPKISNFGKNGKNLTFFNFV